MDSAAPSRSPSCFASRRSRQDPASALAGPPRSVSAGSKQSAGLPALCFSRQQTVRWSPCALFQPTANSPLVSLWSTSLGSTAAQPYPVLNCVVGVRYCLAPLLSAPPKFKVKTLGTLSPNLCHLCKGGRNFLFAHFCSASLWRSCPRYSSCRNASIRSSASVMCLME